MKVFLETFGCQMNRLDSELVGGHLRASGHEMTGDRRAADVVLYNTCSVRAHAEDKVYSRLGRHAARRGADGRPIIGVLGCMAQRLGHALRKRCAQVDIICSPGQLYRLSELIDAAAAGKSCAALDRPRSQGPDAAAPACPAGAGQALGPVGVGRDARMDAMDLSRDPLQPAGACEAFVRIARGCDRFCSYCVVPFVRGPQRSRRPDAIVEEVRRLVDAGRTTITLLGQTVNSYCWRAGQAVVRFSDLLAKVSDTPGLRRLRFVTSHLLDFGDDVLEAMRDLPNVCRYIHCPAQSGSDAVLMRMNRGYTRGQYDHFVDRARAIVPGLVLGGDFIVGFPQETEADHQGSADLIRRSGYKNSFIFKYSARPGTTAEKRLKDDVPGQVKRRRNNELLAVQAEVGLAHHKAYVGRTVEVLVTGPAPRAAKQPPTAPPGTTQLAGRTRGNHIAVFSGPQNLTGRYVDVQVTDANSLTLFARLE